VEAGESTIRFDYRAVGQKAGMGITLLCIVLWIGYAALLCLRRLANGTPSRPAYTLTDAQEFAALPYWCEPAPLPESEFLSDAPVCPESGDAPPPSSASMELPPVDGE
jgi:hypothetical protein